MDNRYNYKPRGRDNASLVPVQETDDGLRYKKDCLCCTAFRQSQDDFQHEVGNCILLKQQVSEWGICDLWDLRQDGLFGKELNFKCIHNIKI